MFGPVRRHRVLAAWFALTPLSAVAQVTPAPVVPPAATSPAGDPVLDPTSPMADLPDIGVDWPDLSQSASEADSATGRTDVAMERRYSYPPQETKIRAGKDAHVSAAGNLEKVKVEDLDRDAAGP